MNTSLAVTGQPLLGALQKGERVPTEQEYLFWFFVLCAVFAGIARILQVQKHEAQESHARSAKATAMPPAELAALVHQLAGELLGIGPHQLDQAIEDLQIPRGDFLTFLDELEQDHGLRVPKSARAMSMSINELIAALEKDAAWQLY